MTMDLPAHAPGTTARSDKEIQSDGASSKKSSTHQDNMTDTGSANLVEIGLSAAIVTIRNDEPEVLTVRGTHDPRTPKDARQPSPSLPFGPFNPREHPTLDAALRSWVSTQTGLDLGYVEQLYTFADRGRRASGAATGGHDVSIGYLALLRPGDIENDETSTRWRSWYEFFPWEDWRSGKPAVLSESIEPCLTEWAGRDNKSAVADRGPSRSDRLHIAFGMNGGSWDEEKVLERFELLYEAGLIDEAVRDKCEAVNDWPTRPTLGQPLGDDYRRILATSIGRIRAKIKYRPVVFELMPDEFTLFELQKTVEAILGPHLHKQNFRRLVESAGLVEPTGEVRVKTGGRPARLYQFRQKVLLERPAPGVRVNLSRN